jgi:hypothetical protein
MGPLYFVGLAMAFLFWPVVVFVILRAMWRFVVFGISRPGMPGDRHGRP